MKPGGPDYEALVRKTVAIIEGPIAISDEQAARRVALDAELDTGYRQLALDARELIDKERNES